MLSDAEPHRALVVDDNVDLAETIADGLLEHGYEALAVTSGRSRHALTGRAVGSRPRCRRQRLAPQSCSRRKTTIDIGPMWWWA